MTQVAEPLRTKPLAEPQPQEPTEAEQVAEILEKAADLVEQGWIRSMLRRKRNGGFSYCAIGALGEASGNTGKYPSEAEDPLFMRATAELAKTVAPEKAKHDSYHHQEGVVYCWNDRLPPVRRNAINGQLVARKMRETAARLIGKLGV